MSPKFSFASLWSEPASLLVACNVLNPLTCSLSIQCIGKSEVLCLPLILHGLEEFGSFLLFLPIIWISSVIKTKGNSLTSLHSDFELVWMLNNGHNFRTCEFYTKRDHQFIVLQQGLWFWAAESVQQKAELCAGESCLLLTHCSSWMQTLLPCWLGVTLFYKLASHGLKNGCF